MVSRSASQGVGGSEELGEARAAGSVENAREVGAAEIVEVAIGGGLAEGWQDAEPGARIVPPGKRQGIEEGGAFRGGEVDGGGLAGATDHGAVWPEAFGFRIPAPEDAVVVAVALVSCDELLVAGNAVRVGDGRVVVVGANQVVVDHRGISQVDQRVGSKAGPRWGPGGGRWSDSRWMS